MTTYISLLRGINVSGKNPIKMESLRQLYESLGFQNVSTYVQSGNVIFNAATADTHQLASTVTAQIKKDFGFEVPIIVLSLEQLKNVVNHQPFSHEQAIDPAFLHITFLDSRPGSYELKTIEEKKQAGEKLVISDDAVYLYCPNGYGKTKLHNTFLEKRLKVTATTRNWKTTLQLLQIAESLT